jgi:hypothetical protein
MIEATYKGLGTRCGFCYKYIYYGEIVAITKIEPYHRSCYVRLRRLLE